MVTYPHSKINLGLNITEKREDGYHNLETIFYPIPLKDRLEVKPIVDKRKTSLLTQNDLSEVKMEQNLVYKAYLQLKKAYHLPEIDIILDKNIPTGAGLGGGSSDASFMLKMLNKMFSLSLSNKKLEEVASKIGADCPFFIEGKPQYAIGIGDVFSPVSVSLKGYFLILVKPNVHISTADAYRLVLPKKSDVSLLNIIQKPIETWKYYVKNDFEKSIFSKEPIVEQIKRTLYQQGALYASMSGSGSSVYGIFNKEKNLKPLFSQYQYFSMYL